MNIVDIGTHLEHQGFSDDEIDEYLAHFGVKGMKWGVRKQMRLDRAHRVAAGKGSRGDKFGVFVTSSAKAIKRQGGLQGAAKEQEAYMKGLKKRTLTGKNTVADHLNTIGGVRIFNSGKTIPGVNDGKTGKEKAKLVAKRTAYGAAGAAATLAAFGAVVAGMGAYQVKKYG